MAKSSAITKPQSLSADLAGFVGAPEMSRGDVMKKLWDYIKQKNLQNPSNKREILCDETLEKPLGEKQISMFKMTAAISKHIGTAKTATTETTQTPSETPPKE